MRDDYSSFRIECYDVPGGGCIAGVKSLFKGDVTGTFVISRDLGLSTQEILHWLEFNRKAGFDISYEESECEYNFIFHPKNYVNIAHFMCAFTAFRMITINPRMYEVALDLEKADLGLTNFEILQIAHYAETVGDSLHMFFGKPSYLITIEEFVERVKSEDSMNDCFHCLPEYDVSCYTKWRKLQDAIARGKYKEVVDFFRNVESDPTYSVPGEYKEREEFIF